MQLGGDLYGRGDWLLFDRAGEKNKTHISERCDEGINTALCIFIWMSDTWRLCIVGVRTAGGGGKCGNMDEWHIWLCRQPLVVLTHSQKTRSDHILASGLSSPDTAEGLCPSRNDLCVMILRVKKNHHLLKKRGRVGGRRDRERQRGNASTAVPPVPRRHYLSWAS